MAGADPDLSMRGGITSIWGGINVGCPTTTITGCCTLATGTPIPTLVVLAEPRTPLNLLAIENKQEQDEQANKLTNLNQMKPESRVGVLNQANEVV